MRNCASGNLEIPGSRFARPGMTAWIALLVRAFQVPALEPKAGICFSQGRGGGFPSAGRPLGRVPCRSERYSSSLVIIYLLGGFSGRFGGYGYGMGHSGMGIGGVILVVLIVLLLLGKL